MTVRRSEADVAIGGGDIPPERLERAEKMGTDVVSNARGKNSVEAINCLTKNVGMDIVVELMGHTMIRRRP